MLGYNILGKENVENKRNGGMDNHKFNGFFYHATLCISAVKLLSSGVHLSVCPSRS